MRLTLVFLALLFVAAVATAAPVPAQCATPGAAAVDLPAQGAQPAPEVGLFTPKAEARGCYTDCTTACVADMCAGVPEWFLQQCSNDCAEGCRCYCGLWCP